MSNGRFWTNEAIALLRREWAKGTSTREIAVMIGHGATRNAVIGKANRLRLTPRAEARSRNRRGVGKYA